MFKINSASILKAVSKKLSQTMTGVTIYKEKVDQNIKYPCVMLGLESFEENKILGAYYLQTYIIRVLYQYQATPGSSNEKMMEVLTQISEALEKITISEVDVTQGQTPKTQLIRGSNKNSYINETKNELEFYINYDLKVAKPEAKIVDKIQTVKPNVLLK